jgi:hypothetical protein
MRAILRRLSSRKSPALKFQCANNFTLEKK